MYIWKDKKRSKILLVLCSLPVAFEGCLLPSRQNLGKFRHVLSNLSNLKQVWLTTDRNFIKFGPFQTSKLTENNLPDFWKMARFESKIVFTSSTCPKLGIKLESCETIIQSNFTKFFIFEIEWIQTYKRSLCTCGLFRGIYEQRHYPD